MWVPWVIQGQKYVVAQALKADTYLLHEVDLRRTLRSLGVYVPLQTIPNHEVVISFFRPGIPECDTRACKSPRLLTWNDLDDVWEHIDNMRPS